MGNNSFRLDNSLKSFHLDKEFIFYIHKAKEFVKANFFEFIGIGSNTILNIRSQISNKEFNEPYELFESVINFFKLILPTINISIYQHRSFDNSLILFFGNSSIYPKVILLNDLSIIEYYNERAASEKEGILMTNIRGMGIGSKAAICIHGYIICFFMKERYFEKHIRTLNTIFTVGLADIIKAKLTVIESKYQDPRTNLYNSKFIANNNEKKPYSVIKIDINDFKMVNDMYGHSEGDKVLEQLGVVLKTSVGVNDRACRDGGDEFLLLIDSTEKIVVEKIILRLNKNLDNLNDQRDFPIYISLGYCVYNKDMSFIDRVNFADEHMYKQKSKNSQIYRLANKISSIKDPVIFNDLLVQIVKNISSAELIEQIYAILKTK